jgi:hypothetical protein
MSEKLNTCLKCFVVFINVIFFMFGCGLIAGGVYILTNEGFGAINTPVLEHFAYAVIGIGVFTFMLSASGCYGALKRKKWALVTYMVFVLIIMVSLAGVSWVLFSSKEALHRIEEGKSSGNKQFDELNSSMGNHFDDIYCKAQTASAAGEAHSYKGFLEWADESCPDGIKGASCLATAAEAHKPYYFCKQELAGVVLKYLQPIASGVAAFAGLMLCLVVASCLLCCYKHQALEDKFDAKGRFVEFY